MKIALLGNPNTGKSSVFNMLTGLRQHVGNFPGVTVDKKVGTIPVDGQHHELIDFPGTYSLYPHSEDEAVVYKVLTNPQHKDYPDLIVYVADASNLQRNLFFFSQVYDLGLPTILVLNMMDVAGRKNLEVNVNAINQVFPNVICVETAARVGLGKNRILESILILEERIDLQQVSNLNVCALDDIDCQTLEATQRHEKIAEFIPSVVSKKEDSSSKKKNQLDRILTHPVWGYLIFSAILLLVFQSIYSFASYPMDLIDSAFGQLSVWLKSALPSGLFTDLLAEGIIPGIGGVVIFVPQIALLFFFIALLEESGYLARAVFILDRLMRPLGLNGKSAVPLLSSVACAIPGVMATRTIPNQKERLITILVAPLMSCSARIPVYTLLIAVVIPDQMVFGFINLQGLVLFGLYFLGLMGAILVALVLKILIKSKERSFLLLELPNYRLPLLKNVGLTVWEKSKVFVLNAGKVILAISVLLWGLSTFGPNGKMDLAEKQMLRKAKEMHYSADQTEKFVASARLENSYIGHVGRFIEPAIQPLGYDWKVGISLLTSFAAREVFVGSLATIYAVQGTKSDHHRLVDRLKAEKKIDGTPVFSLAMGVSLMIYYVFAMQCMSTLAVVRSETKSWKIPIYQVLYMGILAYLGAFIAYQILS